MLFAFLICLAAIHTFSIILGSMLVLSFGGLIFYVEYVRKLKVEKLFLDKALQDQKNKAEQKWEEGENPTEKISTYKHIMEEIQTQLSFVLNMNRAIMSNRLGRTSVNIKGGSRIAAENTAQLIEFVEDAIELANVEIEGVELVEQKLLFYDFVKDLYGSFLEEAKQKSIHIGFNYQLDKGLKLVLDPQKFARIFSRLVKNALKCSPNGSQIIISLEPKPNERIINLIVEDSGPGLNQRALDHVFDFQPGIKSAFNGYGIVPALVRNYADLFDADLTVSSELGKGTAFTFSFPVNLASPKNSLSQCNREKKNNESEIYITDLPNEEQNIQTKLILSRYRGLIVSYDEEVLQVLESILVPDFQILFARGDHEMIELLEKYGKKIDFIICGGDLAFSQNFMLIQEFKSNAKWGTIPFIVATTEARASYRIKSYAWGVQDYFVLPLCKQDFRPRLSKLLKQSEECDEWHTKSVDGLCQKIRITDDELVWLTEMEEIILKEMGNRQFNLAELSYQMGTSERQMFRKVKELTGKTPNKYLRELRIFAAKKLLEDYTYKTVAEISYAVGFQDPHYFSKIYNTQFGKWPSEYLASA